MVARSESFSRLSVVTSAIDIIGCDGGMRTILYPSMVMVPFFQYPRLQSNHH